MNCTCGCSSFEHLHYGHHLACKKCSKCRLFTLKSDCGFVIDEPFVVLDVLDEDHYWRAERYIRVRDGHVPPVLVRDREYTRNDYFELTDRVVAELLDKHFVSGEPHWGYTDMSKLQVNDHGRYALTLQLEKIGVPIGRWSKRPYASDWLKAAA